MTQTPRTFVAVDARGASYTILIAAPAGPAGATEALKTSAGRRVRKLSRGRYLVAKGPLDHNDIEVTSDDPQAP